MAFNAAKLANSDFPTSIVSLVVERTNPIQHRYFFSKKNCPNSKCTYKLDNMIK